MTEAEIPYFASWISSDSLEQELKSSLGTEPSLVEIKQTMVDSSIYAAVAKNLDVAMLMVVGVLGCAAASHRNAVKNLNTVKDYEAVKNLNSVNDYDAVKRRKSHLLMVFTNSVMV